MAVQDIADDHSLGGLELQRASLRDGLQERLLKEGIGSGLDPPQLVEQREAEGGEAGPLGEGGDKLEDQGDAGLVSGHGRERMQKA